MNNYTYEHTTGEKIDFCLSAARAITLEKKHDKSIFGLMGEFDKLSVAFDIVAAAIKEGTEEERYNKALQIYEELVGSGKALLDYQLLIMDILCTAGFVPKDRLEIYKKLVAAQNEIFSTAGKEAEESGE